MMIYDDKTRCSGCGACANICGCGAVSMERDEEGFAYPVVDEEKCVKCGRCKKVCPYHNDVRNHIGTELQSENKDEEKSVGIKVYAVKNKDNSIRKVSSSGGIFSVVAGYVLDANGVVYGAAFDDHMRVGHIRVTGRTGLLRLNGSKYVQSIIKDTYRNVKKDLLDNKKVVFGGTPCQTAGLKSFLGKEYENLILCDIVCHGVTSPKVFRDYKKYIEKKYDSKIQKMIFRDKSKGWANQKWKIELVSGQELCDTEDVNIYKNLFYGHVIQRPACHSCPYANMSRAGDITLGDFWGLENSHPEMIDELGVSVVILNTAKGRNIFETVKEQFEYIESDTKECLQPQLQYPTPKSEKREQFWKGYHREGFKYAVGHYGKQKFVRRALQKVYRKAKNISSEVMNAKKQS